MRFHVDARFARINARRQPLSRLLPGCGLFKLGNAINPNAPSVVGQFAQFVQPQSNVTRSSAMPPTLTSRRFFRHSSKASSIT